MRSTEVLENIFQLHYLSTNYTASVKMNIVLMQQVLFTIPNGIIQVVQWVVDWWVFEILFLVSNPGI